MLEALTIVLQSPQYFLLRIYCHITAGISSCCHNRNSQENTRSKSLNTEPHLNRFEHLLRLSDIQLYNITENHDFQTVTFHLLTLKIVHMVKHDALTSAYCSTEWAVYSKDGHRLVDWNKPWGYVFQSIVVQKLYCRLIKFILVITVVQRYYTETIPHEINAGHSAARMIMSMKNSNDTVGNRTRELPPCRAVPQRLSGTRRYYWCSVWC
jgi:hypothetical protein